MLCIKCNKHEGNKESGFCNDCENVESKRINGVLYIPAASLIFSLLAGLFNFYTFSTMVSDYFLKNKFISYYSLGGLVIMIADIAFTVFSAYFFFRLKTGIRKVMIPYYLLGFFYSLYFSLFPSWLFGGHLGINDIRLLLTGVVGIAIWIPYFVFSRRINEVFSR